MTEYVDDYPTCSATYATLCIYPVELSPDDVTSLLAIAPTSIQFAEERSPGVKNIPAGWFLRSRENVVSRDIRRHLDWILEQIVDKSDVFDAMRLSGVRAKISCYWRTASGHGGPALWPSQMEILASLGLELEFDFYA